MRRAGRWSTPRTPARWTGWRGFAEGAELFVCEASLPDATADDPERGHMTPAEAAVTAVEAGAGRLLLTHVPAESGEERVLSDARAVFPGTVDVAHPGLRIEVGQKANGASR